MRRIPLVVALACAAVLVGEDAPAPEKPKKKLGYSDTPVIPGQQWRVHDGDRPQPAVVTPGTESTQQQPGTPPSDAVVLFDGTGTEKWNGGWKVDAGALVVGKGDLVSKDEFGDIQLHIEWSAPTPPKGESQGRANSGVFLMSRYELQVLDCFENQTYPDGQAAALYGQRPPLVNASRKPGEWQTYDVVFIAPRFAEDGTLKSPARITVLHNGVLVHHDQEYLGPTSHKTVPVYKPHPPNGPIRLQDHGNPVRYRNIWVRPLKGYDGK